MKIRISLVAILLLILVPAKLFAQYDERDSGIYATQDGESIPLKCYKNLISLESNGLLTYEIKKLEHYKGETSGTPVSNTFVLVIKHNAKVFTFPFFPNLSPCYLKLIQLTVNHEKHRREYEATVAPRINPFDPIDNEGATVDFEWVRISENSYEIKAIDIMPGEYAFVFFDERNHSFNYNVIYDFTIHE